MLLTNKLDCMVLFWNPASGAIETRAGGNVKERVGRLSDDAFLTAVDPGSRALALHLYDGFVKIAPIGEHGELREAFSQRIEEMNIVDMRFLYGCERPTLAVLYADSRENRDTRHLKTYELVLGERRHELKRGPLSASNIDAGSNMIIPVPFGGCVVLGERIITYYSMAPARNRERRQFHGMADDTTGAGSSTPDMSLPVSIAVHPAVFRAWGRVDSTRYMLGDHAGRLSMLTLCVDQGQRHVSDMCVDFLGVTSIPSTISYLDNAHAYIGSHLGDSQLVRITDSQAPDGTRLAVCDTFLNVGPIMDFVVVDFDQRGQGQVVTCSGGYKDGAVHVVRNGIGISEISSSKLDGVQGLWSLPACGQDEDKFLVLSFVGGTQVFEMNDDSLDVSAVGGFDRTQPTLACVSSKLAGHCVQVTPKEVRHIDLNNGGEVRCVFRPKGCESGQTIKVVSCGVGCQDVLLSLGNGNIVYATMDDKGMFTQCIEKNIGAEVACMDIGTTATTNTRNSSLRPDLCAIGCWDMTVRVMRLPTFEVVGTVTLEGAELPRSVLLAELDEPAAGITGDIPLYLLCGLGDGHLFSFVVNRTTGALSGCKKMSLGTGPVTLTPIRTNSDNTVHTTHVFACSNRPTVIYSSANANASSSGTSRLTRKLLLSNVNLRDVRCVCTFRNQVLRESGDQEGQRGVARGRDTLALVTEDQLMLGTIDEIQKLHIRKFPHGEMPRRIAYQDATHSFAILTVKTATHGGSGTDADGADVDTSPMTDDICDEDGMGFDEIEKGYVRLYDEQLVDNKDSYELQTNETGLSIASVMFAEDTQPYFVVGTARIIPLESEPSAGRILVFRVTPLGKLSLVTEKDVKGAVYSLDVLDGKLLAGINSRVHLFTWADISEPMATGGWSDTPTETKFGKSLVSHCEYTGQILTLKVCAVPSRPERSSSSSAFDAAASSGNSDDDDMMDTEMNDGDDAAAATTSASAQQNPGKLDEVLAEARAQKFIVGDLMKGVSLMHYRGEEQKMETLALDATPGWLSTTIPITDELFLAADNSLNLYTLVTNMEAPSEEDRDTLLRSGEFHLGDSVNCIRRGSLVMRAIEPVSAPTPALSASALAGMQKPTASAAAAAAASAADSSDALCQPLQSFVYCTANGSIGVLAQLTKAQYDFYAKVQANMARVVSGVGGLTHEHWRMFATEYSTSPARRFLDGDLIELFLDLPPERMAMAVEGLGISVEELAKRVEAIQRATH